VEKQSVTVNIRGREFRVRTADDAESLQRVASYLEGTMVQVEEGTGTIDSLDVAMLTALNLAREVVEMREATPGGVGATSGRLQGLIELAESALAGAAPQG
jgi:cell division protein ZapA (FtsZ GTPase activity inhibitor)